LGAKKQSNAGAVPGKTRETILAAARRVFSVHPFHAASIRMVAAEGGFYHGLIRYHFPSKADIFRAVVEDACADLREKNAGWLGEIRGLGPAEGLGHFLERFMEYARRRPEVLGIIVQNLAQDDLEALPGHGFLTGFLADTRRDFEAVFAGLFLPGDTGRFLDSLNALILHYLGAGSLQARLLGMDPGGPEYLAWVRETLIFVFQPALERMLVRGRSGA